MKIKKSKGNDITMSKSNGKLKKKFKWTTSNIILTVGIVVIMIPVTAFMIILYQAYSSSKTPINGNRFANDLTVKITDDQMSQIDSTISAMADVEDVTVDLKVATLRVYVDVKDDITADAYEELLNTIYTKIDGILPIATYFTLNDTKKQYDLEINAYNIAEPSDTDTFIYFIMNKNSAMAIPLIEEASIARNQELADELSGDTVATGTVEGEDTEDATDSNAE